MALIAQQKLRIAKLERQVYETVVHARSDGTNRTKTIVRRSLNDRSPSFAFDSLGQEADRRGAQLRLGKIPDPKITQRMRRI